HVVRARDAVRVARHGPPGLPAAGVPDRELRHHRRRRAVEADLDEAGDPATRARGDPRPERASRRGTEVDVRVARPVAVGDEADVLAAAGVRGALDDDPLLLAERLG